MGRAGAAASPELAPRDGFRWRLRAAAGSGSSGDVFEADCDGVVVALKVARADAPWLDREAVLLARTHRRWGPALVDAGVLPSGVVGPDGTELRPGAAYLATTWVDGQPLGQAVASTKDASTRRTLAAVVAHGVGRGL